MVTDPPAMSSDSNSNMGGMNTVAPGPTSGNDGSVANAAESFGTAQVDLSKRESGISTPPAPTSEETVAAAVAAADEDDFEASFNEMVEQQHAEPTRGRIFN